MSQFESAWNKYKQRVEQALESRLFADSVAPEHLHQGMAYACLGGGKRFRAMLVYACGEAMGASLAQLDTPACAIEMIHAYSLVHDDLPAMDDDDLRRGRPTCHIQFDEATAILVGDALQTRAFEILASKKWNNLESDRQLAMIEVLSSATGSLGMAGGQSLDMLATGQSISYQSLVQIHKLKTGALISASALLGGLSSDLGSEEVLERLRKYGECIGLAFQITDDILDYTADSVTLGKASGADQKMNKSTYVSLIGLEQAKNEANNMSEQAIEYIQGLGDNTAFLEQLANFVVTRSY